MSGLPIERYMTPSPHTIGNERTLAEAGRIMKEHGIRHLPVLRGGELLGVVSDRDIALVDALNGVDPASLTIDEAIPLVPYTVAPETPVAQVAAEMAKHKYGSAVVMKGTRVLGIFTTVDALRALAELAAK